MKHAFLIMAHTEFDQLAKLIAFLDRGNNEIYLHIDKKSLDEFSRWMKTHDLNTSQASLQILENPIDVTWGGYSQIACELALMDAAVKNGTCDYLHLLSGADIPIKSWKEIDDFFKEHAGNQFVRIQPQINEREEIYWRAGIYHPFADYTGKKTGFLPVSLKTADKILAKIQEALKVDRRKKNGLNYQKGANWFSITAPAARYLLERRGDIEKAFGSSFCCDELFVQTFLAGTEFEKQVFRENGASSCLRYIDWVRGDPYVFGRSDLSELLSAGKSMLFARKAGQSNEDPWLDELYQTLEKR